MRKHNLLHRSVAGWMMAAVILLTTSCLPADKHFHSYRPIPSCGWVWGDTLRFTTPFNDSLTHYLYTVELRHDNSYPYNQIAVAFSLKPADGESTIYTDTLHCALSNDHGVWQGEGWGNLFVSSHPGHTFNIPRSGSYELTLSHIMQRDTLPGIFNVGLKIEAVTALRP